MMRTDALLRIAREIIAKVPACMAITLDGNGDANARVVNPQPLSETWTVPISNRQTLAKIGGN
jgi:hypothetical protein